MKVDPTRNFECLNPLHQNDMTCSMSLDKKSRRVLCAVCKASYNIFDLIGIYYKTKKLEDKLVYAYNIYEEWFYKDPIEDTPEKRREYQLQFARDFKAYIDCCSKSASKSDSLKKEIFLSSEILTKYKVGYDVDNKEVILPVINKDGKSFERKKWLKKKYKWQLVYLHAKGGQVMSLNADYLKTSKKPIFIVENYLDALYVEDSLKRAKAISVNGISHENAIKAFLRTIENVKPQAPLILAFNNREMSKKYQKNIGKILREKQISYIEFNISGDSYSPERAFIEDKENGTSFLKDNIQEALKMALELQKDQESVRNKAA